MDVAKFLSGVMDPNGLASTGIMGNYDFGVMPNIQSGVQPPGVVGPPGPTPIGVMQEAAMRQIPSPTLISDSDKAMIMDAVGKAQSMEDLQMIFQGLFGK